MKKWRYKNKGKTYSVVMANYVKTMLILSDMSPSCVPLTSLKEM